MEREPPEFDESMPSGGNPLEVDVNLQYSGLEFHYVYIMACSFMVWLILPGLGFLYAGLSSRMSAVAMLFQAFMVTATITIQWMFWGYSLTYARDAGPFIGDLSHFGMMNVLADPSSGSAYLPSIVVCFYGFLFCACTVLIVIGGTFERGRIVPALVFGFWWATVVYCPLAYWTWNANGWLYNLGSLDFAGGGPVHIASGWAALAYALVLGKRKTAGRKFHSKPHNVTLVFLGTSLIWVGWFGFNGGTSLKASMRSMLVIFNTNAAASCGVIGWVLVDYIRNRGRFSVVGACEGAIAGLVGITPGAGYVSVWFAALIGLLTGIACSLLQNVNEWLRIDEGLDVFKLHGIGGMVGSVLTGLFATKSIPALGGGGDPDTAPLGAIDGHGFQIVLQLADIASVSGYAFVVTIMLLYMLKFIPGMRLRVSDEAEQTGLDLDQFLEEDIGDWALFHNSTTAAAAAATAGATITDGVEPKPGRRDVEDSPRTSSPGSATKTRSDEKGTVIS